MQVSLLTISDFLNINDRFERILTFVRNLANTVTIKELIIKGSSFIVNIIDTVVIKDSIRRILNPITIIGKIIIHGIKRLYEYIFGKKELEVYLRGEKEMYIYLSGEVDKY